LLRRLALLHGLLSSLFNTVIVALTVNIAAGLSMSQMDARTGASASLWQWQKWLAP